jgi:hypothetical protein
MLTEEALRRPAGGPPGTSAPEPPPTQPILFLDDPDTRFGCVIWNASWSQVWHPTQSKWVTPADLAGVVQATRSPTTGVFLSSLPPLLYASLAPGVWCHATLHRLDVNGRPYGPACQIHSLDPADRSAWFCRAL